MGMIKIQKSTGEIIGFQEEKLRRSLFKSGASDEVVEIIVKEIKSKIYDGISTGKIYKLAFDRLKSLQHSSAAKYKVRKAIMELGPSGFVFEKYISEIFTARKMQVKLNQTLTGRCVKHEVDLLAEKENELHIIECKYHNLQGTVCDVKVPLYFHSRFQDIVSSYKDKYRTYHGWLITNTHFSNDAIMYGSCAGLHLLGWSYPNKSSLRDMIEDLKLYPLTCMTTLSSKEKLLLLERNIILCRHLYANQALLSDLHISTYRMEKIMEELNVLADSSDHKVS
jgi:hypothetical protein